MHQYDSYRLNSRARHLCAGVMLALFFIVFNTGGIFNQIAGLARKWPVDTIFMFYLGLAFWTFCLDWVERRGSLVSWAKLGARAFSVLVLRPENK